MLVGGSAAAHHAGHRVSLDDDHVLADLRERFEEVLGALEQTDGWVTARVRPQPEVDLTRYRKLEPRWRDWDNVVADARALATEIVVALAEEHR